MVEFEFKFRCCGSKSECYENKEMIQRYFPAPLSDLDGIHQYMGRMDMPSHLEARRYAGKIQSNAHGMISDVTFGIREHN